MDLVRERIVFILYKIKNISANLVNICYNKMKGNSI